MNLKSSDILATLDQCCDAFTFPMLDKKLYKSLKRSRRGLNIANNGSERAND
jgi:hypothetical protein